MERVAVVIVNYEGLTSTRTALESLARLSWEIEPLIIAVDNGSRDGSLEYLRHWAEYDSHHLIENRENLGFGAAANQGARYGFERSAKWTWCLNNDVVVDRSSLFYLLQTARKKGAGIAGSPILDGIEKEKIWYAGGKILKPSFVVRHIGKDRDVASFHGLDSASKVSFVCGCSLLISKTCFEETGGFDESFFLYGEDLDLCLKAAALGYSLWFEPRARIWHAVGQSMGGRYSSRREYYLIRNGLDIVRRWTRPGVQRLLSYGLQMAFGLFRLMNARRKSRATKQQVGRVLISAFRDFRARAVDQVRDICQES